MIRLILDAITRLTRERASPILVALDGRSGTGKSTLAMALAQDVPATVVPSDDFFAAEITAAAWAVRSASERARDCIDWRRLRREALEPLLSGHAAAWHPFDFGVGARADGTYGISTEIVRREPGPIAILDGAYSTRGVARRLRVTHASGLYWVKQGWLTGEGGGKGHPRWYRIDDETLARLRQLRAEHTGPQGRTR